MSLPFLELAPGIDTYALHTRFAVEGRIRVPHVLTEESALAMRQSLSAQTQWGLQYSRDSYKRFHVSARQLAAQPQVAASAMEAVLTKRLAASTDWSYIYAVLDYPTEGEPADCAEALGQHVMRQVNQPAMLEFARQLTGNRGIVRASVYVTLFRPGHFLPLHRDEKAGRAYAYVLNLAPPDWSADWGGTLLFHDDADEKEIVASYPAGFNHLMLFDVAQPHSVSAVTGDAPADRLAVSGWFYEDEEGAAPSAE